MPKILQRVGSFKILCFMNNNQKKVIKKFRIEELEHRYEMAWINITPDCPCDDDPTCLGHDMMK